MNEEELIEVSDEQVSVEAEETAFVVALKIGFNDLGELKRALDTIYSTLSKVFEEDTNDIGD